MAHIVCVWELGGELGHLANLKPFVDTALADGHKVSLVVKEIHNVALVFPGYQLPVYTSPPLGETQATPKSPLKSYSQLVLRHLHDGEHLTDCCRAWDKLLGELTPDVVVYDFAPAALVASLGHSWQKWVVGNGFLIPRCDLPFFGLFPRVVNNTDNASELAAADETLLKIVNVALKNRDLPAINDPRDLMRQADAQLLLTLPELDHFGARPDGDYLGIPAPEGGERSAWPDAEGPRVFAYITPFRGLQKLLRELLAAKASLQIYAPHLPPEYRAQFPQISFSSAKLDLNAVLTEAKLSITMGGHNTAVQGFLAAVPQLLLPPRQEQYFLARRIVHGGAGVWATPQPDGLVQAVERSLELAGAGIENLSADYVQEMSGQRLERRLSELFRNV